MATLQSLLDNLRNTRETTTKGPTFIEGLDRLISVLSDASHSIDVLKASVDEQVAKNKASEKLINASDVNKTIKAMMETQLESDKIERERYARFMDMADKLVPEVTEEQIKTIQYQRLVYEEHQKTLQATLAIEKKKVDIQKKAVQDEADRKIAMAKSQFEIDKQRLEMAKAEAEFKKTDKFGTISSAIGGLSAKAQDPLSKFLVQGLGRYIKERKEEPVEKAIQQEYNKGLQEATETLETKSGRAQAIADNRKAQLDSVYANKEATIREDFDIKAYRSGIKDPGSVVSVLKERDDKVAKLASSGMGALNGRKGRYQPPNISPFNGGGISPKAVLSGTPVQSNATFKRAQTQDTSMPTPYKMQKASSPAPVAISGTSPRSPVANGAFGNKGGFLNIGGIGKAIGSLASNFKTFLGPWGFVANSLMAFDKFIPIVSDGAGALMDLSKLVMPMMVSSLVEGFNVVLEGLNGLLTFFDKSTILGGNKFTEDNSDEISKRRLDLYAEREMPLVRKRLRALEVSAEGAGSGVDTTTSSSSVKITKQSALSKLTDPVEESTIRTGATAQTESSAQSNMDRLILSLDTLPGMLQSIQQSVVTAASNPGTTPVMMSTPFLTGWNA